MNAVPPSIAAQNDTRRFFRKRNVKNPQSQSFKKAATRIAAFVGSTYHGSVKSENTADW